MAIDYNKLMREISDSIDNWKRNREYFKNNLEKIKKQAKGKRYVAIYNGKPIGFSDSESHLVNTIKKNYNLDQVFFKDIFGADGYSIAADVNLENLSELIKIKKDKNEDLSGSFFDKSKN